jgi:ABC-type spermidine/putrescine transport system permease subunit II
MREGRMSPLLRAYLVLAFCFLFAPLVIVIAMSFNASPYGTFPFVPTLHWYHVLFSQGNLFHATLLSVEISVAVAVSSALLGTLLAIWLVRHRGPAALALNGLLIAAITVPWLILGVAMLLVLDAVGVGRSYMSIYLGCLAVSLPFVVLVVAARMRELDPALEEAARSLGAKPVQAFWRVTVPLAAPAIAGGALMAFMVCFNNFTIQYFLAPFGVQTLPLEIYTLVRVGYKPDINALATIIVAVTLLLVAVLQWLGSGSQRLLRTSR